jgi:hypothetical protein
VDRPVDSELGALPLAAREGSGAAA